MKHNWIIILFALALTSCQKTTYFPSAKPADVQIVAFDTCFVSQFTQGLEDDSAFIQIQSDCYATFADTHKLQKDLNKAFGRLQSVYPDSKIPTVYLSVTGLQASTWFVNDSSIVVGADLYLGADYDVYRNLVYNYQLYMMRPECIAGDVLSTYLFQTIPYTATRNRLLDQMIYRGKILFLLAELLDLDDAEAMGYTPAQQKWCEQNEKAVWNLIMDRRLLFRTEQLTISSFLNDGPFCADISTECPARIGTYLGMHIVRSYIEHNSMSIAELMDESDSQKILENSYYKP